MADEIIGAALCIIAVLWVVRGVELLYDLLVILIWGDDE
jgi:hypothetical protein